MQTKILQTETMELKKEDYHAALLILYRKYTDDLHYHEGRYKDWAQIAEVYAMSKIDGSGRPVPANVKSFNETVVERRKLSILIKFLRNEIDFIEKFWVEKGFNLEELKTSVKQKTLSKTNPVVKPKEQVAGMEHKKPEKQKTPDPHKILITVKSEPPIIKHDEDKHGENADKEKTVKEVEDSVQNLKESTIAKTQREEFEKRFDESAVEWVKNEYDYDDDLCETNDDATNDDVEGNHILSAIEGDED